MVRGKLETGGESKETRYLYGQVDLVLVLVPIPKEVCQMLHHDNRTTARLCHPLWTLPSMIFSLLRADRAEETTTYQRESQHSCGR